MDAKTEQMIVTMGAGLIRKLAQGQAIALVSHGILSANYTEVYVSAAVAAAGFAWSFWNDYGKVIFFSQMEVLRAKSLAQAEKMRIAGVAPVTTTQIAMQSRKMDTAEVTAVVATLPAEIKANIAPAVVKVLIALFLPLALLGPDPAMAQTPRLKPPQFTGDFATDAKANLGINKPGSGLTGNPLGDLVGALDVKLLPDLQYALKLATASGSKVTGPCYQAWIDIINVRQKAVEDAQGQSMELPDPHLVTDFEKLVELRNSLQPDSDFMIKCSPVASMVKKDIAGFIGIVISGGAGLATLVPGL